VKNLSHLFNSLHALGGTSITSGLELAVKVMQDRKIENQITSLFLLSDGMDDEKPFEKIKNLI
jgi:hypothetical protein